MQLLFLSKIYFYYQQLEKDQMKEIFTLTLLIFCMPFLTAQIQHQQKTGLPSDETIKNKNIIAMVIPTVNNTWGYDISIGKKLVIHQPSIPGIPGNEGFKTKTAAQKTADFVITKIKKGEMPPTVTMEELKKLKTL
jgi:hypothetical protein